MYQIDKPIVLKQCSFAKIIKSRVFSDILSSLLVKDFWNWLQFLAAKNLGEEAYSNFLDHTYISDRKTTIRKYLATTGAGIMEKGPAESLKIRYGG